MSDVKIDYNTANIVLKINIGGKNTEVFLPPASQREIKDNALVLGEYNECMNNIATNVLLVVSEELAGSVKAALDDKFRYLNGKNSFSDFAFKTVKVKKQARIAADFFKIFSMPLYTKKKLTNIKIKYWVCLKEV